MDYAWKYRSYNSKIKSMENKGKNLFNSELWTNKEVWKDAALIAALLLVIYLVYVTVEYWPEISEGFKRGWNSR